MRIFVSRGAVGNDSRGIVFDALLSLPVMAVSKSIAWPIKSMYLCSLFPLVLDFWSLSLPLFADDL